MVPLLVPEALAVIQPEESVEDQERVPPPVLETVMYCVGGLVPFTAVKVRLVGLTPITGAVVIQLLTREGQAWKVEDPKGG